MSTAMLLDGSVAEFREAADCPEDRRLIRELFARASEESLYYRFFHVVRQVNEEVVDDLAGSDGVDHVTVLCIFGNQVLGTGSYTRIDPDAAEITLLVDDAAHGRGIGTRLLAQLIQAARKNGFKRLEARVLRNNHRMLRLLAAAGFARVESTGDEVRLALFLDHDRNNSLCDGGERDADRFGTLRAGARTRIARGCWATGDVFRPDRPLSLAHGKRACDSARVK